MSVKVWGGIGGGSVVKEVKRKKENVDQQSDHTM